MPVDPQHDPYYRLRHSLAHVMAQAVLELFPEGKIAIGPPIEDGFYYDFDLPRSLTPDDLEAIETRMRQIIPGNHPFSYRVVSADEARTLFHNQPYKLELIEGLVQGDTESAEMAGNGNGQSTVISTYRHDTFEDLCRGPHLEHTGQIAADGFKLLSIAGAYWRGNEKNPMLQRVYGTAWNNKAELDDYLWRMEEARRRDHRRLGKELDLFSISEDVGPGLILWHPKGAQIRVVMEDFMRKAHLEHGYEWVFSPHVGRAHLWHTSGHLDFYQENMYAPMEIEEESYYVKPMNCPFHIKIYQSHVRSYRDLPMRYAEYGTVYRYERSGVLHGLPRVRGFTQDDAHIFCRPDQIEAEITRALEFSLYVLRSFGLTDFTAYIATRPAKYVGEPENWEHATQALYRAVEQQSNFPYEIDPGGGAFYGPKIDLKVADALGRSWQLSTIQFDFNLPERFGMEYIAEDGQPHRPYMVHRALLGSFERFFGMLIEYYGGAFPVWLAPVQATLIPITDRHMEYTTMVQDRLRTAGIRAEIDQSKDRMQAKIRRAQLQKVPYMLIIGDKEQAAGAVAVRQRSGADLGAIALDDFVQRVCTEVETHA
ncbi:MAG: threonine--tRNA ligase [Chloroflexaceae bacterium]|nr:threonine--tRNA ligase [Chloroflexaceae bacterium]